MANIQGSYVSQVIEIGPSRRRAHGSERHARPGAHYPNQFAISQRPNTNSQLGVAYVEPCRRSMAPAPTGRRIRDWETQPDWPQIVPESGVSETGALLPSNAAIKEPYNVGRLTLGFRAQPHRARTRKHACEQKVCRPIYFPISKITNDPLMGVGRGRGSRVGSSAAFEVCCHGKIRDPSLRV